MVSIIVVMTVSSGNLNFLPAPIGGKAMDVFLYITAVCKHFSTMLFIF